MDSREFWKLPEFEDEFDMVRARLMRLALLVFFIAGSMGAIITSATMESNPLLPLLLGSAFLHVFSYALLRAGRARLSVLVFLCNVCRPDVHAHAACRRDL